MMNLGWLTRRARFSQKIDILRRTTTLTAGVASHAETPATIRGSVQPAPGEALSLLPEGTHLDDAIIVYTSSTLRAANEEQGAGDVVIDSGRRYQVMAVPEAFRRYGHNGAVCVAESMSGLPDA